MHTISDVLFWRTMFVVAMLAALVVGVAGWKIAVWIRGRVLTAHSGNRAAPALPLRQARS